MIPRARKALVRFDGRVWLLLFALLAFRFGHGLCYHTALGIPLSLVGLGSGCSQRPVNTLARGLQLAAVGLVALAALRRSVHDT